MSIATRLILVSAAGLIPVLGACGDDPVEPGGELTEEESVALLRGTMALLWTESAMIHASEDSVVVRCQRAGQMTGAGKLPDEEFNGDTVRLVIDYRFTPSGCGVTRAGKEFTLDGDPSFRYQFFIETVGSTQEYDITGSFSGGVKWQLGDRAGNCAMDLTLVDAEPVVDGVKGTFEGKLCGHEVETDAEGLLPSDV